jgi:hypothetical protein
MRVSEALLHAGTRERQADDCTFHRGDTCRAPLLEISTNTIGKDEVIEYAAVRRSAPCGSTWYIARKLSGVSTKQDVLYDAIAKAHHSFHAPQP